MSLKSALQADLAAKGKNLGDLAEKLGITQQSVSKWIAKDEIPKDRLEEVMAFVKPGEHLTHFLIDQMQRRLLTTNLLASEALEPTKRLQQIIQQDDQGPRFAIDFSEQPSKVSTRQRTVGIQVKTRRAAQERWAALLSDVTRSYVRGAMEINEAPREFDYLSPKLAILVRAVPMLDATRLISIAMPLMLLKRVRPSVECWLALLPRGELDIDDSGVTMDDQMRRFHARRMVIVKADLEMLGVKVIELARAEELATRIEAAENPEEVLASPPFSYEDYPEEL